MIKKPALLAAAVFALAACTNSAKDTHFLENIFIPDDDRGQKLNTVAGLSLDVKQRLVTSSLVKDPDTKETVRITCAEPSPDAISQLAAQFSANLSADVAGKGGGSAAVSRSFQETVQDIGKRTTTIQLLRDLLYRNCEAHANGMDRDFSYHLVLANMDRVLLQMIAVEGLSEAALEPADEAAKTALAAAASAQSELNALRGEKSGAETTLRLLQDQHKAKTAEVQAKTGNKAALDKAAQELQTEITKQEGLRDKAADADKPAIQTKIDDLTKTRIEVLSDSARLNSEIGGLTAEVAEIGTAIGTAKSALSTAAGKLTSEKIKDLEGKIAAGGLAKKKANRSIVSMIREIVQPGNDRHAQKKLALTAACMMWLGANDQAATSALGKLCQKLIVATMEQSAEARIAPVESEAIAAPPMPAHRMKP